MYDTECLSPFSRLARVSPRLARGIAGRSRSSVGGARPAVPPFRFSLSTLFVHANGDPTAETPVAFQIVAPAAVASIAIVSSRVAELDFIAVDIERRILVVPCGSRGSERSKSRAPASGADGVT